MDSSDTKHPERTSKEELDARRLADSMLVHAVTLNWPKGKVGAVQRLIDRVGHEPFSKLKSHHFSDQRMPGD